MSHRAANRIARNPRCAITIATLRRQEFITRRVKLIGKGVEIGGHAATSGRR
jgi:hypothetical protein